MYRHALSIVALVTLVTLAATTASADTGTVTGSLSFYDKRSYTARPGEGPYTDPMRNSWRPVRRMKIYVEDLAFGNMIALGTTDAAGRFNLRWTYHQSNPVVRIRIRYESSYVLAGVPRFSVTNAGGYSWVSIGSPFYAVTNGNVDLGTLRLGSSASPSKLATMFTTATDFWERVGAIVPGVSSRMKGVEIRFPVAAADTGLTLSRTRIEMADNWVVFNNSTLAHELGHVAQLIEFEQDSLWGDCSAYGDGHSWDSSEWQSCAFSEGFADFVAAATFFVPWAQGPTSYGYDIEGGCSGLSQWSESNTARMFWDIYDTRNENGDDATVPIWWILEKLDDFPDGTASRQDLENSVNRNGTNAWDYRAHARAQGSSFGIDLESIIDLNCVDGSAN